MNRLNGVNIEIQIAFQSHHLPLLIPFLEKAGIGSKEINDMIEAYIASGEKLVYERKFEINIGNFFRREVQELSRTTNLPSFFLKTFSLCNFHYFLLCKFTILCHIRHINNTQKSTHNLISLLNDSAYRKMQLTESLTFF